MEVFDCIVLKFLLTRWFWTQGRVFILASFRLVSQGGLDLRRRGGLRWNHISGLHGCHWDVSLLDPLVLEITW